MFYSVTLNLKLRCISSVLKAARKNQVTILNYFVKIN